MFAQHNDARRRDNFQDLAHAVQAVARQLEINDHDVRLKLLRETHRFGTVFMSHYAATLAFHERLQRLEQERVAINDQNPCRHLPSEFSESDTPALLRTLP